VRAPGRELRAGDPAPRRRPGGPSLRPRPARCLAGLRVVACGRNRAARLARVLEALRPAVERGAEVVYVDRGSRDGSDDLVRRRFPFARIAADLEEALAAHDDLPPPRFVAVAGLGAEADWRCLRAIMRAAARGASDALFVPGFVGPDGRAVDPGAASGAAPPVWCARASTARQVLTGGARPDANVIVLESDAAPALLVDPAPPASGSAEPSRPRRASTFAPASFRANDASDRGMAAGGRRP